MNKISLIQLSETEVITKLLAVVVINDDEVCNVPVTIVNHMNGNCDFSFHTS